MKTARHRKRGGGGGQQPAGNQETQERREHRQNRGVGKKKTTQSTQGRAQRTQTSAKAQGTRGRKTEEARNKGAQTREEKKRKTSARQRGTATTAREGGGGATTRERPSARQHKESESARRAKQHKTPRPRAPGAGNQREQETKRAQKKKDNGETEKKTKTKEKGGTGVKQGTKTRANPAWRGPSNAESQSGQKKKVRRTKTRPGGRPARPGQDGRAHAYTHRTRVWRPPTRKGRCRRPHETASVHRPGPPSNDGRYGKPDALVTGSTHANHRSARSPRPTPEGPARDNPIAGPRTGTTRSEPSVPASAGASGRHNEPSFRPASACPAQPPSKAGGASSWGGERHHGIGKADRSTESYRTGRGTAHQAGPRGTPERHAAGHNQGTRTGAKQQRPPGAANQESSHNNHQTTAQEQVPSNTSRRPMDECAPGSDPTPTGYEQPPSRWTSARLENTQPLPATNSRRPDGRVHARRVPSPYRLRTAAVRMDECAPGGYPAPTGYEQPPSGWTSERPAATPQTRNSARATHSTTHRASTPVNRSQAAQDTVHATQPTERAHR